MKRAVLVVPLLLAALLVVPATGAWACSCAVLTPAQAVDGASVVVRGTVVGRADPEGKGGGLVSGSRPVTYTVAVAEVYKGTALERTYVRSAADGASCGLEVEPGREYVLFARSEGKALSSGLCDGTAPAQASFVAQVEAVTGSGTAPGRSAPQGPGDTTPLPGATAPGGGGVATLAPVASAVGGVLLLVVLAGWLVHRRRRLA